MDISIITPSFGQLDWLKLCIASVADQGEVTTEHIIQDAGSTNMEEWSEDLKKKHSNLSIHIEKDSGMYDAVNRGILKAKGEIVAYLNCDEQYLPGVLSKVVNYFSQHPNIDILFADMVVVDPDGKYLCHRKALLPEKYHTLVSSNLAISTCATFFRRSAIQSNNLYFDTNYKVIGDGEWILRVIDSKIKSAVLREFTSTFTDTGGNLDLTPNAFREKANLLATAPLWARISRKAIVGHYRLRRLLAGTYYQKPFAYEIYTKAQSTTRNQFHVPRPTVRWVRPDISKLSN